MSKASVVVSAAPVVTFVQIQVLTTMVLPDDADVLRMSRPGDEPATVSATAQSLTSSGKVTDALPPAGRVTVMPPLLLMISAVAPPLMRAQNLAAAAPRSPL